MRRQNKKERETSFYEKKLYSFNLYDLFISECDDTRERVSTGTKT